MATIAERAAAGQAFLDEKDPGWWREDIENPVDLDRLDAALDSRCVLGQRQGRQGSGLAFSIQARGLGLTLPETERLGFSVSAENFGMSGEKAENRALTEEWRKVITDLRAWRCGARS